MSKLKEKSFTKGVEDLKEDQEQTLFSPLKQED